MKIKCAFLFSFVVLASLSVPAAESSQETNTVVIDNFSFIPPTLTVP